MCSLCNQINYRSLWCGIVKTLVNFDNSVKPKQYTDANSLSQIWFCSICFLFFYCHTCQLPRLYMFVILFQFIFDINLICYERQRSAAKQVSAGSGIYHIQLVLRLKLCNYCRSHNRSAHSYLHSNLQSSFHFYSLPGASWDLNWKSDKFNRIARNTGKYLRPRLF